MKVEDSPVRRAVGEEDGRSQSSAISRPALWTRIPTGLVLFALGLSVYLITLPADLRNNADTNYRVAVTKSIVLNHSVELGCGPTVPDTRVVGGRHGCYYAIYAPGQTLLMVPLFEAGRLVSRITGMSSDFTIAVCVRALDCILGALLLVVFYLLALQIGYRRRTGIVLTLILGFASTLWPDEQSGQEHVQVALALTFSIYALLRALHSDPSPVRIPRLGRDGWLLLCGLSAGFGILTRYDFIVEILVLALFVPLAFGFVSSTPSNARIPAVNPNFLAALRALILFSAGVIPFVVFDGLWNAVRFGAPWQVGQSASAQFGFPVLRGITSLLVSPAKGVVWYLPLLWLLPFAAAWYYRRSRLLSLLSTALFLAALLFYANVIYWHGDPGWGPRYLYVVVPLLVLPLGEILERFSRLRRPAQLLIPSVILVSLVLQLAAVGVDQWRFWYKLIEYRKQAGQLFEWKATKYRYYWSRNPNLYPELYQFAAAANVFQIALGHSGAKIHLYWNNAPSSGTSVNASDNRDLQGVARRPLNTVTPIWLNNRYHWYFPAKVPLGIPSRVGVLGVLGLTALISALLLHLQFWKGESDPPPDSDRRSQSF